MIYKWLAPLLLGGFFVLACTEARDTQPVSKPQDSHGIRTAAVETSGKSADSTEESPRKITLRIRNAQEAAALRRGLNALGFSNSDLEKVTGEGLLIASGHRLLETESLELAEVFSVNLDRDTAEEYVSQVILDPMPDPTYREQRIVYFIALHDDAGSGYTGLQAFIFDETRCDEYPEHPLTFRFEPIADQPARHKVIFDRNRTEACGVRQRTFYRQHDTLLVANGVVEMHPGTPYDKQTLDFGTQMDEIIEDEDTSGQ